jgi:parallel beta-helix repeat protein
MRTLVLMVLSAFLELSVCGAEYRVSVSGSDSADGTAAAPWRTIQRGVDALKAGDTLRIGAGVYRERIELKTGGTADGSITIAAETGARVVVCGADLLADGWTRLPDGAWEHDWALRFPINGPDDLTHPGDPAHLLTGRAEQVFDAGRLLTQVLKREQLGRGTFFVDLDQKKLVVRLRDDGDPTRTDIEAGARGQWFVAQPGVSHVRVRGIVFRCASNHAQRGAFILGNDAKNWTVEDCTFERANGPGATFTGTGHVFRRCYFQDNGQLGFGAWACHDTRMEECTIQRNNLKGYSTAWEAGGLKITMSRGFALLRCRAINNRGVGIWYDIGNEKAEVAHCLIADNDEAGIFYEISYGLHAHDNLVINNANLGEKPRGAWAAAGITLSSSEDCVIENNTLAGNRDGVSFREQNRTTPRIGGGEVRVLNRNHTVRRNVIAHSQAFNIAFWMDTTFFGPHPAGHDKNDPVFEDPKTLGFRFEGNVLTPLSGRPNYLYGPLWRERHKTAGTPGEFKAVSGIEDSSLVSQSGFVDETARDFRLRDDSAASKAGAGVREMERIPR